MAHLRIESAGSLGDIGDSALAGEPGGREPLPLVAPNCLLGDQSLVGEPQCVALYRSVADATKVGAHAMWDLPRNVRFGPWMEEEEEEKPSSRWMQCIQSTSSPEAANLTAFYRKGLLYCKTSKEVRRDEELLLLAEESPHQHTANSVVVENCSNQAFSIKDEAVDEELPQSVEQHRTTDRADAVIPQHGVQSESKAEWSNTENPSYHAHDTSLTSWSTYDDCAERNDCAINLSLDKNLLKEVPPLHKCSVCDTYFFDEADLRRHEMRHIRPYAGFVCLMGFRFEYGLRRPELYQAGERPFVWPVYKKSVLRKKKSARHTRNPAEERSLPCSFCSRTFAREDNLKKHLGTHTGKSPYVCLVCNESFLLKHQLTGHEKSHFGGPFDCSICSRSFKREYNLKIHEKSHT